MARKKKPAKAKTGKKKVETTTREAELLLRLFNNKKVTMVITMLKGRKKPATVTEIYQRIKLEQSVTSQALRSMRKLGIVLNEREGKFIRYSLNAEKIAAYEKACDRLVKLSN